VPRFGIPEQMIVFWNFDGKWMVSPGLGQVRIAGLAD